MTAPARPIEDAAPAQPAPFHIEQLTLGQVIALLQAQGGALARAWCDELRATVPAQFAGVTAEEKPRHIQQRRDDQGLPPLRLKDWKRGRQPR